MNRLTVISYPDTTSASYGYDVLWRLTTATNANGTVTMAYDNRSRVSSVTDVFGKVVSYIYDASSNRTQLSLGGVSSATYQYDVINRLSQLTDGATLNTMFGYDATDKLTSRTLPNGVVTSYQYDDLNRLTGLTHSKSGNTLADFQYQLNAVGSITQMTDDAGAHTFTYDTRDRLTAATHPNQTNESYTLDDVGNRTASQQGSSYSYQAFNRLATANSNTYSYDANGNLTSKTDSGGSWSYTWDYENQLKQASKSGGATVTYNFDALGRRIQRTSSVSGTTKFVYDGADVIRDLDGSGATVADYLNGPGIDNKLRQTVGGTASYFLTDRLGTTRALTDVSGIVTANLTYDSSGNVTSGSVATRYTFTGREGDSETGLMFYRARWYDPQQGRFISEDPIGFGGGANWYGYVANNPMISKDPTGLCPQNTRSDLPDYARSVYQGKLGEQLTKCINKVFSETVTDGKGKTGKGSDFLSHQQIRNAPYVDETESVNVGGGYRYGHSQIGDENVGPYGTVRIAGDIKDFTISAGGQTYTIGAFEIRQRTYVHELGNNLSRRITGGNGLAFGDTNGIVSRFGSEKDFDTGAVLEKCVFGDVAP